jgi:hypothetical protein
MKLKDFVVVTGMPGVYKIAATRNNGMMVEDFDTGKVKFASSRQHQFSPLESISIFTEDDDAVELGTIFQTIMDKLDALPLPSQGASSQALREYFTAILPKHDRERVHSSDIKKVVRWFSFLNERGLLVAGEGDEEE